MYDRRTGRQNLLPDLVHFQRGPYGKQFHGRFTLKVTIERNCAYSQPYSRSSTLSTALAVSFTLSSAPHSTPVSLRPTLSAATSGTQGDPGEIGKFLRSLPSALHIHSHLHSLHCTSSLLRTLSFSYSLFYTLSGHSHLHLVSAPLCQLQLFPALHSQLHLFPARHP